MSEKQTQTLCKQRPAKKLKHNTSENVILPGRISEMREKKSDRRPAISVYKGRLTPTDHNPSLLLIEERQLRPDRALAHHKSRALGLLQLRMRTRSRRRAPVILLFERPPQGGYARTKMLSAPHAARMP